MAEPPKVFISYSHDTPAHKQWVLDLAIRLRNAGIDASIDQWDLRLGEDLARFMEDGIKDCGRVIVVCSDEYVQKAAEGKGGIGYERQIVTAELIKDLGTTKFVPILRGSTHKQVPPFLGYRAYLDFDSDANYDIHLELLLRELHGVPSPSKPPIGMNPFVGMTLSDEAPRAPILDAVAAGDIVAETKARLAAGGSTMLLHDWLLPRFDAMLHAVRTERLLAVGVHPTKEEFNARVNEIENATGPMAEAFAVAGYWAAPEQLSVFLRALRRLLQPPEQRPGQYYEMWVHLEKLALGHLYAAAGVAAVTQNAYGRLKELSLAPKAPERTGGEEFPLIVLLQHGAPFQQDFWQWLPGAERRHFPFSEHLAEVLRPTISRLGAASYEFDSAFDRFQVMSALIYADVAPRSEFFGFWAPLGSFVWRRPTLVEDLAKECVRDGAAWPPLAAGLFGGDPKRVASLAAELLEFIRTVRHQKGVF